MRLSNIHGSVWAEAKGQENPTRRLWPRGPGVPGWGGACVGHTWDLNVPEDRYILWEAEDQGLRAARRRGVGEFVCEGCVCVWRCGVYWLLFKVGSDGTPSPPSGCPRPLGCVCVGRTPPPGLKEAWVCASLSVLRPAEGPASQLALPTNNTHPGIKCQGASVRVSEGRGLS